MPATQMKEIVLSAFPSIQHNQGYHTYASEAHLLALDRAEPSTLAAGAFQEVPCLPTIGCNQITLRQILLVLSYDMQRSRR
jgi:hypothetical protein